MWACECETGAMDYHSIRQEFGRDLRLIGGIDLDALRFGRKSIQGEVLAQVRPPGEWGLYSTGGWARAPRCAVRGYVFYRQLLDVSPCSLKFVTKIWPE